MSGFERLALSSQQLTYTTTLLRSNSCKTVPCRFNRTNVAAGCLVDKSAPPLSWSLQVLIWSLEFTKLKVWTTTSTCYQVTVPPFDFVCQQYR